MPEHPYPNLPILLVDDEEAILRSYAGVLRVAGITNLKRLSDSRQVMPFIADHPVELMVLDLLMPHYDGHEILAMVTQEHPDIPVIISTGIGTVDSAVSCMRTGAYDYLVKPVEQERLITTVRRALEYRQMQREIVGLKKQILGQAPEDADPFFEIITRDETMLRIFRYIRAIARTSQPVMITGETGVGKELVARAIHTAGGRPGPFIAVNIAGLDDNMFADTLFGHQKGAFTGADQDRPGLLEKADTGTLLLDEIGDLSQSSQVKLLRLLQSKEYLPLGTDELRHTNARILVATNRDIELLKDRGEFRKDLYYRLATHHIHLPPLRERSGDIPLLADYFLARASEELGKNPPTPPRELYSLLQSYHWPGNVRELYAIITDAVSRHESMVMSLQALKDKIHPLPTNQDESASHPTVAEKVNLSIQGPFPTLKLASEFLVQEAVKRSDGNLSLAARMLGISRQALSMRLKKRPPRS